MKKLICLSFILSLLLFACSQKTPQSHVDEDTVVLVEDVPEEIAIEDTESNDDYVCLGNVHCEYYDKASGTYKEYQNAELFAKVLSNNLEYYFVSLKTGGKKYPVTKCDPYNNRDCNGKFIVGEVRYLVYIQTWDNTGSQGNTSQGNNDNNNNTQTIVVEHKQQPRIVQKWQNCGGCGGSGSCGSCRGSGQNIYNISSYERCMQCGGSGRCQYCGGRGGWNYEAYE